MTQLDHEPLYVERYRPRTIDDTILPAKTKATFQEFVKTKNFPNLLLVGRPGTGKTSTARAMLDQIGCNYMMINGSLDRNIDTLRNEIQTFASSVSFTGGRKCVILDEADNLNHQSTQPALRNFMEEYSNNCGFILTANHKDKIHDALHSRCSVVEFSIKKEEGEKIKVEMFKRIANILTENGIEYDNNALGAVITKHFPDMRRMLNELQRYSTTGKIDAGAVVSFNDESFDMLFKYLKNKEFMSVRKWIVDNNNVDTAHIFRKVYDAITSKSSPMQAESIPRAVVCIGEYQYKSSFVADQEINLMAMFTEIMIDCKW